MARRLSNSVGTRAAKPSPPPPLPASEKPSPSAVRIANAFDLLAEDSSDVNRLVTVVDANVDVDAFLAAEKEREEEAQVAERERRKMIQKKSIKSALFRSVLAFPSNQPPRDFQRRSPSVDDQGRGQGGRKQWVPKSQSQSQNDDDVKAAASPSGSDQTQGAGSAVDEEVVDGKKQVKEEGVNNGAESSEGTGNKSKQNKNGSALRKVRKLKKAAAGGEESAINQEVDTNSTSSTQNQNTRLYTLKEYEEMKKEKDNGSSVQHQQYQPKTVTLDVNKEFRRPREDQMFNNGGQRFNNEGRRFNNGGRRFNNRDQCVDEEKTPVPKPKPAAEFRLRDSDFPTL